MEQRTAVILAAGLGVRMGPRGRLTPKGLISVGGAPLVEQSVAALRDHGMDRIIIVTGHLSEQYDDLFGGTDVELVHNPHYATTGSLLSLQIGLETVDSACVIAESDVIYAPQALGPLDGRKNRYLVSGPTGAGDEVYVWARGGMADAPHMYDISKSPTARSEPWVGEMIGLSEITAETVPLMRTTAERVLKATPEEHYEAGFVALSQDVAVECPVLDVPWAEIDDEVMLERANRLVVPQVQAARAKLL